MKNIIKLDYVCDSIIEVKKKKFNEDFTNFEELEIIKKVIIKKIERNNLNITLKNDISKKNFNIINTLIFKSNKFSLDSNNILNIDIKNIIYDEEMIYLCICEIMMNKIYNSLEHNCLNCTTECCGKLNSNEECYKWSYDFKNKIKKLYK